MTKDKDNDALHNLFSWDLLLSIYVMFGIQSVFYSHYVGSIHTKILGMADYQYPLERALRSAIPFSILGSILVYFYLHSQELKKDFEPKKDSFIVILIITIVSFIGYINDELLNVWNFLLILMVMGIVGLSIYFRGNNYREINIITSLKPSYKKTKYLELWHDDIKQKIQLSIQVFFLLITGVAVAGFAPLYTERVLDPKYTEGIALFFFASSVEVIYLLIGAWFGIICPWFNLLRQIRLEILNLET